MIESKMLVRIKNMVITAELRTYLFDVREKALVVCLNPRGLIAAERLAYGLGDQDLLLALLREREEHLVQLQSFTQRFLRNTVSGKIEEAVDMAGVTHRLDNILFGFIRCVWIEERTDIYRWDSRVFGEAAHVEAWCDKDTILLARL